MLTIGILVVSCALFYGLVLLLRQTPWNDMHRRGATIALWLIITTLICWLLFQRDDAAAANMHRQNVGMPVVYLYVWLLAVVASPLIVLAITRLPLWKRR
jgi:type VI protein secretion system component VasK